MPFAATWIDLEIIVLTEGSQKEIQMPYDITYMQNHVTINLSAKQKLTHRHRQQICGCQLRGGEELNCKFGISRCKLLYIEQINKVLLYSPENYIQYPIINHNRKEYENMRITFQKKLTQHSKSSILQFLKILKSTGLHVWNIWNNDQHRENKMRHRKNVCRNIR